MLPDLTELKQQLMLPQLLNGGLETLFNNLVQRTGHCEPYLRKLNGKVLRIRSAHLGLSHYLIFSERHIDVLQEYEGESDCEVSIAPRLLFKFPEKSHLTRYLNDKSIILNGDFQVLQDFVGLIEFLQKDPAELLSPYIGDVAAQSAVDFGRKIITVLREKTSRSQGYWGERLTEEYQLIAPSLAIADFCDQVKTLEKQTVLLEQKIRKLADEN